MGASMLGNTLGLIILLYSKTLNAETFACAFLSEYNLIKIYQVLNRKRIDYNKNILYSKPTTGQWSIIINGN